jgi:hypothetical protein
VVVGGNFGQLTADVQGNFGFGCTSAGNYLIQLVQASSNTPFNQYVISCAAGAGVPPLNTIANPTGATNILTNTFPTTFTAGDFGASPITGAFNFTDTSTSTTDTTYEMNIAVPSGSYHNPFVASVGINNAFSICNTNGAVHTTIVVAGSGINCPNFSTSQLSKMWAMAASSNHAAFTAFDWAVGYTANVVQIFARTIPSANYNFLATCASASATDGSCNTFLTTIRGDGLFSTQTINFVNSLSGGTSVPTACNTATSCMAFNTTSGSVTPTVGQSTMRFNGSVFLCSINGSAEVTCNGGGSGTVSANSGSAGAIAVYSAAGGSTTVNPNTLFNDSGSVLTYTGASGVSAVKFSANGSGSGQLSCTQGGLQTDPAIGIAHTCPTTVPTGYQLIDPSAATTGYLKYSTSTNQTGCTASATHLCGIFNTIIPIGDVGTSGLSGTAPIVITTAGAISCTTCVTTSAPGAVTLVTSIPSVDTISAAGSFATTLSVPGTGLQVGSLITVRAHGIYTTTATASPVVIFQVNAGGTTGLCSPPGSITLPISQTNVVWNLICYIQINTTGGPGTALAWGDYEFANNVNGATAASNNKMFVNTATSSFTTTSSQNVTLQENATLVSGQAFTLQSLSAQVSF